MPGHMNVLLAEANIPYEQLKDLDEINSEFEDCDVALVLGANDVVNPSARHDKSSPIFGMPILDVDKSRTVIINKRTMNTDLQESKMNYLDLITLLWFLEMQKTCSNSY